MQYEKPTTIKDIAKKFNCSPSTVSRALNNHTSINLHTRKNIQEYAQKVGYHRNKTALKLLSNQTYTIGVIVPNITSYLFAAIIDGMQNVLEPLGYALTIYITKETYGSEVKFIEKLLANNVDGIFVSLSCETRDFYHFKKVSERGTPIVYFDRVPDFSAHKVSIDHYLSAKMAVQHLIEMGCKRIAHLKGPEGLALSQSRLNGYLDALKENNLPIHENLIEPVGFKGIKAVFPVRKLLALEKMPDGLFAANDETAVAAMHTIQKQGLNIPNDIAVIGFDNEPGTPFNNPSLSTIFQPRGALGEEVAHIFLQHINHKNEAYPPQHIVLPTQLVIRESTLKIKRH